MLFPACSPLQAPAWPHTRADYREAQLLPLPSGSTDVNDTEALAGGGGTTEEAALLRRCLEAACSALQGCCEELNVLDGKVRELLLSIGCAACATQLSKQHCY